jgi:serine/threonine-protein kinase
MDFGISHCLGSSHVTRDGQAIGTARYMSPEQIQGGEADVRSDIYALGVVLFELLAGTTPFDSANDYEVMRAQVDLPAPHLSEIVAEVPAHVAHVVARALEKDPARRFGSTDELAAALDAGEAGSPARVLDFESERDATGETRALTPVVLPALAHTMLADPPVRPPARWPAAVAAATLLIVAAYGGATLVDRQRGAGLPMARAAAQGSEVPVRPVAVEVRRVVAREPAQSSLPAAPEDLPGPQPRPAPSPQAKPKPKPQRARADVSSRRARVTAARARAARIEAEEDTGWVIRRR